MKVIPLTHGKEAIVDDADYPYLSQFKWHLHKGTYARRVEGDDFMHRLILGAKTGEITDHRNRNGLDNRRSNLRIASIQQSAANRRTRKDSKSQRKGVRQIGQKWRAEICVNSRTIHLGYFKTQIEAASAYSKEAIKHFGEFACI